MRSILQCLCNAPCLEGYFNKSHDNDDVKRSYLLGFYDKVAEEFGSIMKAVWAEVHQLKRL